MSKKYICAVVLFAAVCFSFGVVRAEAGEPAKGLLISESFTSEGTSYRKYEKTGSDGLKNTVAESGGKLCFVKNSSTEDCFADFYPGTLAVELVLEADVSMRNFYLRPFRSAVEHGVATVMNSYNTIGGTTTSSSKYLLRDVLKKELGFEGFVISDWAAVEQLTAQGIAKDRKDAARISINAGVDMDMADGCFTEHLKQLVEKGTVDENVIDEAVSRVLRIKDKFGLFENPYPKQRKLDMNEHDLIAEQCSNETIVLLKNDNILPLKKDCRAIVTGPFTFEKRSHLGNWTLDGDLSRVSSIADEICAIAPNTKLPSSRYLWDDCLPDIRSSEVIIVSLGESWRVTAEANSLSDVELPKEQLEYVKKLKRLGKPVVGVLCFARPIALGEAEKYFDAIIYAWHSGTRAAKSIASVLFGEINPSGRLPMTMPRTNGQIPIYYNQSASGRNVMSYYKENSNIYHSYLDLVDTPLYPFGYGLSYATFVYGKIRCGNTSLTVSELLDGRKFKVSATVKNIGKYGGKEVVQCYVRDIAASMSRPIKELKGIKKIYIEADGEADVEFEIGYRELGFYNENSVFTVEPGSFEIYIGADSYTDNKITVKGINGNKYEN